MEQSYKGWKIWKGPDHPVQGRWQAERFGVDLHSETLETLKRQIDRRIEESPTTGGA